jgi:taurine transport system substrate-binding protein
MCSLRRERPRTDGGASTQSFATKILAAALMQGWAGLANAADTITIGYQTTIDPAKVAQADGLYEKAIGRKIDWRKFDSGAEVNAAIASGAIDIGYVGSSPLAAAASNRLPIQTFFIAALIGDSEALVVRDGAQIKTPKDLAGKTVAVPFVSTTHYSLLAALKHWGIDPSTVKIVNVRPPEIAAGWARGDIDAAYVWDPALGAIKPTGTVLVTSTEVAKWGAPTFDAYIVRTAFADAEPAVVAAFAKVTADAYADYRHDPARYTVASEQVQKISKLSGAKPEDIPALLAGNKFPVLEEQASKALLGGGTAKAVADTSAFLVEQKKIPAVLGDYSPYISARFVQPAKTAN